MTFANVIINFVACTVIIEILLLPFLIYKRVSVIFSLYCLSIALIIIPDLIAINAVPYYKDLSIVSLIGFALYPLSNSLIINNYFLPKKRIALLPVSIVSAFALFGSLIFSNNSLIIISILLLISSFYTIFVLSNTIREGRGVIFFLFGGFITFIAFLIVSIFTNSELYLVLSAGIMFVFISLLYLVYYFNKVIIILNHVNRTKELNKNLLHNIAMQSQRLEMLKRIIQDKDVELLQMSKHASLAEITTGIAHEITQPLTGIKGIAQNMIDDINLDEFDNLLAVSELLKICSMVDKSSSIINHIRNFSKKSNYSKQFVDINKVILNAMDLISVQFARCNIEIILDLNEDIQKIHGDKIALEQLIINILLNARDAIIKKRNVDNEPEFNGTIRIVTKENKELMNLILEDNGIGIPDNMIKEIWSPFFTTKRRAGNTGIGLSISNKIIKEHNGDVTIESKKGIGTRFVISFPVKVDNIISVS